MKSAEDCFKDGNLKLLHKDYDEARLNFTQAITSNPKCSAAFINRGYVNHMLEDFKGEVADYTAALAIEPDNESALFNRGLALIKLKKFKKAISDLSKVIELNEKDSKAYYHRAIAKQNLKDYFGARVDIMKALDINPDLIILNSENDYSTDRINEIVKTFIECSNTIKGNPRDTQAYMARAELRESAGDNLGALADYSAVIRIDYCNIKSLSRRAYIKCSPLRDCEGAIKDCNSILKIDRNNDYAYLVRGWSKSFLKDVQGALNDYSQIVDLYEKQDPDFNDETEFHCLMALTSRAHMKKELKDYQGAIDDYTYTIKLSPNADLLYTDRGQVKFLLNDFEGAITDFTKAIKIERKSEDAYFLRGKASLEIQDFAGAIQDFDKAIKYGISLEEVSLFRDLALNNI
ncbi:MAG: tetratricopeptide repeat protein [Prolixibacteraceae bacterium]|jgi:tetratricopeptide (TPR) repeat protein|nr:tetratricopeptide repeat protein [Prolixibacteraceae bacterium]